MAHDDYRAGEAALDELVMHHGRIVVDFRCPALAAHCPSPPPANRLAVETVGARERRHRLAAGQGPHDLLQDCLRHYRHRSGRRLPGSCRPAGARFAVFCPRSCAHRPAPNRGVGTFRRSLPRKFHAIADSHRARERSLEHESAGAVMG